MANDTGIFFEEDNNIIKINDIYETFFIIINTHFSKTTAINYLMDTISLHTQTKLTSLQLVKHEE